MINRKLLSVENRKYSRQWENEFMANKFSLNVGKAKYSSFHKPIRVDDLPLQLPKLSINNQEIKRTSYTKFLWILLDENPSWTEHLKYTENKTAKSIGLMQKVKTFLDKDFLLSPYFSYIHSYTNYGNLAWANTHKTNLKKIHSKQKHALRILYNKDRYNHTKELFSSWNVLNVYKLNLLNTSIFMHKIKNGTALQLFIQPLRCLLTRIQHVCQA